MASSDRRGGVIIAAVQSVTGVTDERRGLVGDTVAFWTLGGLIGLFLFAAAAPSPLYHVYAVRWDFSSLTLTIVFAVYAFALLAALQVTGRLSDHLGRRPVILGAIAVEILAMACFIAAESTLMLGVARVVQGAATGCAMGALTAGLVDFADGVSPTMAPVVSTSAPTFGLAFGGIVSSALVQYGPSPLRLIYWVVIAGLLVGAALVLGMREPRAPQPGALASLKPIASIDPEARPTFVRVAAPLIALWALSGFFLSLAPTLIAELERSTNLLWGGAVVFALNFVGAVTVVARRRSEATSAMLWGCVGMLVGVAVLFVAIATRSAGVFVVGSALTGVGFGLSFLGAFREVTAVAAPERRAGTLAVLYIVSYLAFSIPIVIAGVAETHWSAHDVALVFSVAVAALSAIGIVATLPRLRELRTNPHLRSR
jgi:MFS family permease